jgi:hypothetical protein
LPALFHFTIAETKAQKNIDICIVSGTILLTVFCTYVAIDEAINPPE